MFTQPTITIILFLIAGLSVIISIMNWLYLNSLSTRMNEIEQEIDKKAQEFDLIKKEHNTTVITHPEPIISYTEEPIQTSSSSQSLSGSIQIMRNVRGSFETAVDPSPPYYSHEPEQITNQFTPPPQMDTEVHHSVHERTQNVFTDNKPDSLPPAVIALYNNTSKDADFNHLWTTISRYLASGQSKKFLIDFSGINFLYDKELKYLLKITQIVAAQGGSISFINCDNELVSIMSIHQPLTSFINQKRI